MSSGFSIPLHMDATTCKLCNTKMSCGLTACMACGAAREYIDPKDTPLNRAKLEALGDLLPRFAALCSGSGQARPILVRWKLSKILRYVKEKSVETQAYVSEWERISSAIEITSPEAAQSVRIRHRFEQLLTNASEARAARDNVMSMRLINRLEPMRNYMVDVLEWIVELHYATASAILAVTLEEADEAQRDVWAFLDRTGESATQLAKAAEACLKP
jgi:hypothetical protein